MINNDLVAFFQEYPQALVRVDTRKRKFSDVINRITLFRKAMALSVGESVMIGDADCWLPGFIAGDKYNYEICINPGTDQEKRATIDIFRILKMQVRHDKLYIFLRRSYT